jgi:excisionase family DNA binding protein
MNDESSAKQEEAREEFLTARQLARLLQVSETTVHRLARERRIPSLRLTPRLIRFHLPSVRDALGGNSKSLHTRSHSHHTNGAMKSAQLSFDDLP